MSVSTPVPPKSLSLPARPSTVSAPESEAIRSEPVVPLSVSSPVVKMMMFASGKLERVSLPNGSPMVSATNELAEAMADSMVVPNTSWVTASEPSSLIACPFRIVA